MKIVGKTDKGFKRSDNQDRFVAGTLENGISFGFVCDGMGGANGGSVASGMLCKTLEEMLFLQSENNAMNAEETVLDAVSVACAQIYTKAENDKSLSGMGTTLSGVSICDDTCNVYNVGDSRVYILRAGVLTQITEDHSVVRQLFRQGAISEEEMASHPQKNLITRAVGVRKEVEVDVSEIRLKKGDRLLCASDGLTNFVPKREIESMMMQRDLYAVPDMLIKAALKNDASDNITALVLEY